MCHVTIRSLVYEELKNIRKETGHGLVEAMSFHLPGGTEESDEEAVRIFGVLTEHLLNTSLRGYCHINLLGSPGSHYVSNNTHKYN
jgi:hypothetical protein